MTIEKPCSKCKRVLPSGCFHKDPKGKFGLQSRCKECARQYQRERDAAMTPDERRLARLERRLRDLPEQIARKERQLAGLYQEAKALRMNDVLTQPSVVCAAWDREAIVAALENEERDANAA